VISLRLRGLARLSPPPQLALLLPLALLVLAGHQLIRLDVITQYDTTLDPLGPRLFPGRGALALAVALFLTPAPWAVALCLWRSRRGPAFDSSDRVISVLSAWLVVPAAVFSTVLLARAANRAGLAVALALAGAAGLAVLLRQWRATPGPGRRRELTRAGVTTLAVGALLASGGWLSVRFGQDYNWDLRSYHLYSVHAWVQHRLGLDFAPCGKESYFNPLADLPYYLLVRTVPPAWVGFGMGVLGSCTPALAFVLAYRVLRAAGGYGGRPLAAALLCAVAGLYEPVCIAELGTTFNDSALTALVLASLAAAVRALGADGRSRWAGLAVAGCLAGMAVGLKLTFGPFAAAGAGALLLTAAGWRRRLAGPVAFGLGAFAGFLLTDGFWALHLYRAFGNPVFPFLNQFFHSPYWYPTEMSVIRPPPRDWLGHLLYPFTFRTFNMRKALEVKFRDSRLAVLAVLLAGAAIAALVRRLRRRPVAPAGPPLTAFLVAFAVLSYVAWDARFHILRYLCPLQVVAPLTAAVLLRQFPLGRLRLPAAAVVCALVVAGTRVNYYERLPWADTYLRLPDPPSVEPDALVLMSWKMVEPTYPCPYVLTTIPPSARVIDLDAEYLEPGLPMRREADELIARHTGPIYLLSLAWPEADIAVRLTEYGLHPVPGGGRTITLQWCRLRLTRFAL
jgi:hypothetical protein